MLENKKRSHRNKRFKRPTFFKIAFTLVLSQTLDKLPTCVRKSVKEPVGSVVLAFCYRITQVWVWEKAYTGRIDSFR